MIPHIPEEFSTRLIDWSSRRSMLMPREAEAGSRRRS